MRPLRQARFSCAAGLLTLVAVGCEGVLEPDPSNTDAAAHAALGSARGTGTVTIPFVARFYTDLVALIPDPACGDPPRFLNIQEGVGEATHLGRMHARITFCVDATDILDDGQLTEGESLPYDGGIGTLTAANGDQLRLTIAGAVVPSDHPDFDFEFADPFEFVGGTGRFEGATGGGMTESFVDFGSVPSRTTHLWSGTLTRSR